MINSVRAPGTKEDRSLNYDFFDCCDFYEGYLPAPSGALCL